MADGHVITGAQAWLHSWDISGEANSLEVDAALEIKERRAFSTAAVLKDPGLVNASAMIRGVFDMSGTFGTGAFDEEGNKRPYTMSIADNSAAEGDDAIMVYGHVQPSERSIVQGELYEFGIPMAIDGVDWPGRCWGRIEAAGTKTSTFSSTGSQMGAVAAGQTLCATLHVTGSPTGTMDVIVESDDNSGFTTPTTRLTFTQVTTSATSEALTLFSAAGITDDWWRITATLASTPSYPMVCAIGIV